MRLGEAAAAVSSQQDEAEELDSLRVSLESRSFSLASSAAASPAAAFFSFFMKSVISVTLLVLTSLRGGDEASPPAPTAGWASLEVRRSEREFSLFSFLEVEAAEDLLLLVPDFFPPPLFLLRPLGFSCWETEASRLSMVQQRGAAEVLST